MPNLPIALSKFVDDGRIDRSKESFQGLLFERLDQRDKKPISFFRSDFRKSRIIDCIFYGNSFSRCDFISSIFENSVFLKCDFSTSSIMYSVFRQCKFENNHPFNPDLFRCRLSDCILQDQKVERATWRDSTFSNCRFVNCEIEKSTLQNLEFEGCDLHGLDLSQMSATDFHFVRCVLDGVTIDPDYLGTYTFEDVDLSNVRFAYRSAGLDFSTANAEDFLALASYFETQRRWSEAFNTFALLLQMHGKSHQKTSLEKQWERCLLGALDLEIPADAAENVRRLFRYAKHYLNVGLITISGSLVLLAGAELISRLSLNPVILEEVAIGVTSFRRAVETRPNMEAALASDPSRAAKVRFQVLVDIDNEDQAKTAFESLLSQTAGKQGIRFEILRVGYGSVIIEAASWFVVVMMFFRAARAASYTFAEIKLISKARDRIVQIMDQSTKPTDVLETIEQLHRTLPKETNVGDLVGDEIADLGRSFSTLMHEVKVGGLDFLALVREVRIFVNDLRKLD